MLNLAWPEPYKSKDERDLDRMIEADLDFWVEEKHREEAMDEKDHSAI